MVAALSYLSKVTSVFYFAFGANLDEGILSRRVLATPDDLSWFPARLDNYKLSFNIGGTNLIMESPSYASVVPAQAISSSSSSSSVHGVIYELTLPQWGLLCASEGVPLAYVPKVVECNAYTERGRVNAYTLMPSRMGLGSKEGRPSKRYIDIIRKGARKQSLNEKYIQFLDTIEPF